MKKQPPKIELSSLKFDLPASIVVFLVALPLCLGIAVASEAQPFAGIISGIIGGIVVGAISNSHVSVSGPAAGLTAIVAAAIISVKSYEAFLVAVVIAGMIQLVLGMLKAGFLAQFVPNSVIKGMLAAIGLILILKQLPHAVGYDDDYEGDFSFSQPDHENTITELWNMFNYLNWGAVIIALFSLGILLLWETKTLKKSKFLQLIPAPLIVVISGVMLNELFMFLNTSQLVLTEAGKHLVQIPEFKTGKDFLNILVFPDFSALLNPSIWVIAIQIALVASLESLLSIEATDKIDPYKRITLPNRELQAQGAGNIVAGMLGGIPVTAVIVRSSANINAGAKTKYAAIFHGLLLLLCLVAIPGLINRIPYSALAAVLLMVGYKLTKPALFKEEYKSGYHKFIPFVITILSIIFTDLLIGIMIGILTGVVFTIRNNYRSAISIAQDQDMVFIKFKKDIYFVNKPLLKAAFSKIKDTDYVILDMTRADFIDPDILEMTGEFIELAKERKIRLEIKSPVNSEYNKTLKKDYASV